MHMPNNRLQQLTELLKDTPDDAFLLYAIALEHQSAGDHDQAIAQYEYLLSIHPDYLPVFYQLGGLYALKGDTMHAEKVYNRGIALASEQNNPRTLSELRSALDLM
jgi:tetratricopeptide (TPR) repeat protein